MAGARQKAPGRLANTKGGRGAVALVSAREDRTPPPCPIKVGPVALEAWNDFWESWVADAVDWKTLGKADKSRLREWIRNVDLREQYYEVVSRSPSELGSMGQLVRHHLWDVIRQLESRIMWAEDKFGMNPTGRFRLQLTIGEASESMSRLQQIMGNGPSPAAKRPVRGARTARVVNVDD